MTPKANKRARTTTLIDTTAEAAQQNSGRANFSLIKQVSEFNPQNPPLDVTPGRGCRRKTKT